MKNSGLKPITRLLMTLLAFCSSLIISAATLAQSVPEKVEVDINAHSDNAWYGQPWMWIVGLAVFIVIIVAITRGNRSAA